MSADEKQTTVVEINPADLGSMHREMNKGMMVSFINRDLVNRANLDVRTSTVLYDEDKDFVHAVNDEMNEQILQNLFNNTPVRFYSKGV